MNRKEAEDFVYKSYLKAEKYQDYNAKDSDKRRPDLTREMIRAKSGTPCVLVTGSKGKGSVSNMISQILQINHNVGLMTSPHITDFCERFKINGINVSDSDFAKYMTLIADEINAIDEKIPQNICISPMGIQADFALALFNDKGTDFNVFECGKGAKFDDVNNIKHEYAVINSIFLEHTRELGETLEAIAEDKSYVITGEQKCVYVAVQKESVAKVFEKRANEMNVQIKIYGRDFWADNIRFTESGMVFDVVIGADIFKDISIPLMGEHQARNCALAMAFCKDVMQDIDIVHLRKKLREIDWPGRMEVISAEPFVLLDACINSASCVNVKDVLRHMGITKCTTVIGIPDDKDYLGVAKEMMEVSNTIILSKSQNPHYVFTEQQKECLKGNGIDSVWKSNIGDAIETAQGLKLPIVILGTTSVISEVKKISSLLFSF